MSKLTYLQHKKMAMEALAEDTLALKVAQFRAEKDKENKKRSKKPIEKGLNRSFFQPQSTEAGISDWLGVRVLHKRTGKDTFEFQRAYAENKIVGKRGKN